MIPKICQNRQSEVHNDLELSDPVQITQPRGPSVHLGPLSSRVCASPDDNRGGLVEASNARLNSYQLVGQSRGLGESS